MKKTIFFSALAVLAAASVSVFVYMKNETNPMDELFNANVEALASGEGGGNACWNTITSSDGQQVRYCPICGYVPGKPTWYAPDGTC